MQDRQQAIQMQESLHFLDYWRIISSRKEVVISVFLLLVVTGVMLTFTMRKTYSSSCLIQISKETPDVELFTRNFSRYDPLFLRTQFEVIQSRPVIEEAIRRLNLSEKLASAYGYAVQGREKSFQTTVKLITKSMKVQQFRETNLIEIQIYMRELGGVDEGAPTEAAKVANMIAEVYRSQNSRRSRDIKVGALDALKEALDKRRQVVLDAETLVEDIRRKYKIDLVSKEAGTDSSLKKVTLIQLENRRILANHELIGKRSRYEKLLSLTPEDRLKAVHYVVQDPALASLVSGKRKAEVDLQQNLKDFGERHPEVVRVNAVIKELETKINDALQGLMTGLRIDYEATKAQHEELTAELEKQKTTERERESQQYREYEKAVESLDDAKKMRDMLEIRYMEEKIELSIPKTTVEVMEPAKVSDQDDFVRPNHLLNIILSVLVGLACGVGLAFFVEYLDTSVKTIDDIEQLLNLPVLGVIPQKVRPFTDPSAQTTHAESYRVLRANIQFSKGFKDGKILCVTSGSVGEGKSLTIFNLAYCSAQLGDRILIVDADLHRPTQHKMLKLPNEVGLANVLAGDMALDDAIITTDVPNLDFLPSGKMNSGTHGLLDTTRMKQIAAYLRDRYDFVFLDAPPIIGVSDTSLLVREVDGVLLVIQHRKYPRAVSSRARFMIENVGGKLIGVVLNNLNISRDYSYYGYTYHSYKQYSDAGKKG